MKAYLYLIPVTLGDSGPTNVFPAINTRIIQSIRYFIVENVRTARRFLKMIDPSVAIDQLTFFELNKHTSPTVLPDYLLPAEHGNAIGLMSEAGCPGVADPGAAIVRLAHQKKLQVVPLVGPSSILLSVMASGMNGQNFAFNGYLPVSKSEKIKKLQLLEKRIQAEDQTQLFIETPYRNTQLFNDLIAFCNAGTRLCIACDLTLESEYIETRTIQDWKDQKPEIQKRPAIFVLGR